MKTTRVALAMLMIMGLAVCGILSQGAMAEEGFRPSLDTSIDCHIDVVGGYSNFEALEAEFDRFNEYYPNVELIYTKIDDYGVPLGLGNVNRNAGECVE
jgi:multiple sugar transport system substrate-binding protein